jgi:hypothetical protein
MVSVCPGEFPILNGVWNNKDVTLNPIFIHIHHP